jgi:hypothetical protein
MKTNLLCTFVHKNDLQLVIDLIQKTYELDSNIIFVLSNQNKPYQLYCTYNVVGNYELSSNTILIHRKSDTNTLYTINAMNQIIKSMNNGVLDTKMQLQWESYQNQLILFQNDEVVKIPLKLEKIIRL